MCVLALWLTDGPHPSLVVGANRDEAYARPSAAPAEIEPGIIAGRDLEKGGTWLGVTRRGLFVAVTNRWTPPPDPHAYSRGQLTLDALRCATVDHVVAVVESRVAGRTLAGFNLVAVAGGAGVSLHYDGALRRADVGPGAHVISTNCDLNDPDMPEKAQFDAFVAAHAGVPDEPALRSLLASHQGARPICKHGDTYGTVSSTMLRMGDGATRMSYAPGPPCVTEFSRVL